MDNIWVNFAISTVLTVLKEAITNPVKRAELKRALLKVRNAINAAYAGDPDFS